MQDQVRHMELVNALSTNKVDSILEAILKMVGSTSTLTPSYGSPLHLVITLCEKSVVEQVLNVFCRPGSAAADKHSLNWICIRNTPDGQTPLHLASKLSRHDIIDALFMVPNVDDTLRDSQGKTAEELAQTERMADIFACSFYSCRPQKRLFRVVLLAMSPDFIRNRY